MDPINLKCDPIVSIVPYIILRIRSWHTDSILSLENRNQGKENVWKFASKYVYEPYLKILDLIALKPTLDSGGGCHWLKNKH